MSEDRYKELWSGTHEGVRWEIAHWNFADGSSMGPIWNYYLQIPLGQVPEDIRDVFCLKPRTDDKGRVHYDYSSAPIISDLEWHGGITYYAKRGGVDGASLLIEIGCDYNHYWDEGHNYDKDYVLSECRASIDKLRELVPNLKWRCGWNGKYYAKLDGKINEYGNFISNEGAADDETRRKTRAAKELSP